MANYFATNFTVPFLAIEDLTSRQFYPVSPASSTSLGVGVASAPSGCNPTPVGVLVNDPSAGQEAAVVVWGFTKARARACGGSWLEWGTWLRCASDGFEPTDGGDELLMGRWFGSRVTTADASVIGNTFVMCLHTCVTGGS